MQEFLSGVTAPNDWRSRRRGCAVNTRSLKPSERSDDRNRSAWLYLGPRAVNRLGCELSWTGEEHEARRGLISEDEWLMIKDLAPARGGGAPGTGPTPKSIATPVANAPHRTGDPSSSSYQAEYGARKRYEDACDRLRDLLEAGDLEAVALFPGRHDDQVDALTQGLAWGRQQWSRKAIVSPLRGGY